jgi:hypothetical protein
MTSEKLMNIREVFLQHQPHAIVGLLDIATYENEMYSLVIMWLASLMLEL